MFQTLRKFARFLASAKACIGLRDSCIHCSVRLKAANFCDTAVSLFPALPLPHKNKGSMNLHLQTTAGICKAHLHTCSFGLSRRLFGRQHSRTFSCGSSQTHTCLHQNAKLKSSFFAPLPTLQGQGCSQHRCFRYIMIHSAQSTATAVYFDMSYIWSAELQL